MFERVCEWGTLASGGCIGYASGNIKRLADDLRLIRPTFFPSVPRVLNKIYAKIQEGICKSQMKAWLLKLAVWNKRRQLENGVFNNNTIWDR